MEPSLTCKRVFVLGAGFSKAAHMPLATELTDMLIEDAIYPDDQERRMWLADFMKRLRWSKGEAEAKINAEELFHYAALEMEGWKMRQHCCPVDRMSGPDTPYRTAETIASTMRWLAKSLPRVILREQQGTKCDLSPISQFVACLKPSDAIITFNYDTLVEHALTELQLAWNHGLESHEGVSVLKLHGSIDWVLLERHRRRNPERYTLLYSKTDLNAERTGTPPSEDEHEYHSECSVSAHLAQRPS
jgi:hypothetical protein